MAAARQHTGRQAAEQTAGGQADRTDSWTGRRWWEAMHAMLLQGFRYIAVRAELAAARAALSTGPNLRGDLFIKLTERLTKSPLTR